MRVSVCITTFNEEESISALLSSLLKQTNKPDEIIIVDAKSFDSTTQIINNFRKRFKRLKLIIKRCSRAEGRNIAVRNARYNIIAMTDAKCVIHKNWLKRIVKPFEKQDVAVVAGFYKMQKSSSFQKALSVFLGVNEVDFNKDFLPSTRSIAFKRGIWKRVGGFPEKLKDTAEDTIFNYKVVMSGTKIVRVKDAIVYWMIPQSLKTAVKKIYSYAKGDARSRMFWHPIQKLRSHNIKVLLVCLRYLVGFVLVYVGFKNPLFWMFLIIGLILYIFYSFNKVYQRFSDLKAGVWGIVIQFLADWAVMAGFLSGVVQ